MIKKRKETTNSNAETGTGGNPLLIPSRSRQSQTLLRQAISSLQQPPPPGGNGPPSSSPSLFQDPGILQMLQRHQEDIQGKESILQLQNKKAAPQCSSSFPLNNSQPEFEEKKEKKKNYSTPAPSQKNHFALKIGSSSSRSSSSTKKNVVVDASIVFPPVKDQQGVPLHLPLRRNEQLEEEERGDSHPLVMSETQKEKKKGKTRQGGNHPPEELLSRTPQPIRNPIVSGVGNNDHPAVVNLQQQLPKCKTPPPLFSLQREDEAMNPQDHEVQKKKGGASFSFLPEIVRSVKPLWSELLDDMKNNEVEEEEDPSVLGAAFCQGDLLLQKKKKRFRTMKSRSRAATANAMMEENFGEVRPLKSGGGGFFSEFLNEQYALNLSSVNAELDALACVDNFVLGLDADGKNKTSPKKNMSTSHESNAAVHGLTQQYRKAEMAQESFFDPRLPRHVLFSEDEKFRKFSGEKSLKEEAKERAVLKNAAEKRENKQKNKTTKKLTTAGGKDQPMDLPEREDQATGQSLLTSDSSLFFASPNATSSEKPPLFDIGTVIPSTATYMHMFGIGNSRMRKPNWSETGRCIQAPQKLEGGPPSEQVPPLTPPSAILQRPGHIDLGEGSLNMVGSLSSLVAPELSCTLSPEFGTTSSASPSSFSGKCMSRRVVSKELWEQIERHHSSLIMTNHSPTSGKLPSPTANSQGGLTRHLSIASSSLLPDKYKKKLSLDASSGPTNKRRQSSVQDPILSMSQHPGASSSVNPALQDPNMDPGVIIKEIPCDPISGLPLEFIRFGNEDADSRLRRKFLRKMSIMKKRKMAFLDALSALQEVEETQRVKKTTFIFEIFLKAENMRISDDDVNEQMGEFQSVLTGTVRVPRADRTFVEFVPANYDDMPSSDICKKACDLFVFHCNTGHHPSIHHVRLVQSMDEQITLMLESPRLLNSRVDEEWFEVDTSYMLNGRFCVPVQQIPADYGLVPNQSKVVTIIEPGSTEQSGSMQKKGSAWGPMLDAYKFTKKASKSSFLAQEAALERKEQLRRRHEKAQELHDSDIDENDTDKSSKEDSEESDLEVTQDQHGAGSSSSSSSSEDEAALLARKNMMPPTIPGRIELLFRRFNVVHPPKPEFAFQHDVHHDLAKTCATCRFARPIYYCQTCGYTLCKSCFNLTHKDLPEDSLEKTHSFKTLKEIAEKVAEERFQKALDEEREAQRQREIEDNLAFQEAQRRNQNFAFKMLMEQLNFKAQGYVNLSPEEQETLLTEIKARVGIDGMKKEKKDKAAENKGGHESVLERGDSFSTTGGAVEMLEKHHSLDIGKIVERISSMKKESQKQLASKGEGQSLGGATQDAMTNFLSVLGLDTSQPRATTPGSTSNISFGLCSSQSEDHGKEGQEKSHDSSKEKIERGGGGVKDGKKGGVNKEGNKDGGVKSSTTTGSKEKGTAGKKSADKDKDKDKQAGAAGKHGGAGTAGLDKDETNSSAAEDHNNETVHQSTGFSRGTTPQVPTKKQVFIAAEEEVPIVIETDEEKWFKAKKRSKQLALLISIGTFHDPMIAGIPEVHSRLLAVSSLLSAQGYQIELMSEGAQQDWLKPTCENIHAMLAKYMSAVSFPDARVIVVIVTRGVFGNVAELGGKTHIAFASDTPVGFIREMTCFTPETLSQKYVDNYGNKPLVIIDAWPLSSAPFAMDQPGCGFASLTYERQGQPLIDLTAVYPKNCSGLMAYYLLRAWAGRLAASTGNLMCSVKDLAFFLAHRLSAKNCRMSGSVYADVKEAKDIESQPVGKENDSNPFLALHMNVEGGTFGDQLFSGTVDTNTAAPIVNFGGGEETEKPGGLLANVGNMEQMAVSGVKPEQPESTNPTPPIRATQSMATLHSMPSIRAEPTKTSGLPFWLFKSQQADVRKLKAEEVKEDALRIHVRVLVRHGDAIIPTPFTNNLIPFLNWLERAVQRAVDGQRNRSATTHHLKKVFHWSKPVSATVEFPDLQVMFKDQAKKDKLDKVLWGTLAEVRRRSKADRYCFFKSHLACGCIEIQTPTAATQRALIAVMTSHYLIQKMAVKPKSILTEITVTFMGSRRDYRRIQKLQCTQPFTSSCLITSVEVDSVPEPVHQHIIKIQKRYRGYLVRKFFFLVDKLVREEGNRRDGIEAGLEVVIQRTQVEYFADHIEAFFAEESSKRNQIEEYEERQRAEKADLGVLETQMRESLIRKTMMELEQKMRFANIETFFRAMELSESYEEIEHIMHLHRAWFRCYWMKYYCEMEEFNSRLKLSNLARRFLPHIPMVPSLRKPPTDFDFASSIVVFPKDFKRIRGELKGALTFDTSAGDDVLKLAREQSMVKKSTLRRKDEDDDD